MKRVALVRMDVLSEPDPDEAPLLGALRDAGIDARSIVWTRAADPEHDPANYDACILRATWDYYKRPAEFVRWLQRAATVTRLFNSPRDVLWNMHKSYMLELEARGVPIVPTLLVRQGEIEDSKKAESTLAQTGWSSFIIKPAVSAGSWMTTRHEEMVGAAETLVSLARERDTLVQPVIPEFAEPPVRAPSGAEWGGEVCVVWIDGQITHAVRKRPRYAGEDESVSAADVTDAHRALAGRAIDASGARPMYARIDMVERRDGSLLLSELELIEPSLFFDYSEAALKQMVLAVRASLPAGGQAAR